MPTHVRDSAPVPAHYPWVWVGMGVGVGMGMGTHAGLCFTTASESYALIPVVQSTEEE